jgi:hypothetical protein
MKTPLLIVLAVVVLGTGSALAIMNNACKSSHYAWCAPDSSTAKSASEAGGRTARRSDAARCAAQHQF